MLRGIVIPEPFDLHAFCDSVADLRGKRIVLLPLTELAFPDSPCGVWLGLDTVDLIFYEAGASDLLKTQIVLHELAHILLGHQAPEFAASDTAGPDVLARIEGHFHEMLTQVQTPDEASQMPVGEILRAEAARIRDEAARVQPGDNELGMSADRLATLLGRTDFKGGQERDAEDLATIMLERASRSPEALTHNNDAAGVLDRLNDAFGHPARIRK